MPTSLFSGVFSALLLRLATAFNGLLTRFLQPAGVARLGNIGPTAVNQPRKYSAFAELLPCNCPVAG
jgi:hypothetical protein